MPLVDLCVFGCTKPDSEQFQQDFIMQTIVSRSLGPERNAGVINILNDPDQVIVLLFPSEHAIDLEQGIQIAEKKCGFTDEDHHTTSHNAEKKRINLIFIDATWKHAREMESKLTATLNSKHWIRVQLVPTAFDHNDVSDQELFAAYDQSGPQLSFIQRRFEIRAPPSPNHLSTAECLAWVASRVERDPVIYESIMKVLDHMVHLWRVNIASSDKTIKEVMSQKTLNIKHRST